MKRERRSAEVRALDDTNEFECVAVAYGIVDDYGTSFAKGVFNESLDTRMPVIAWGHDWSEPIGRGIGWREDDTALYIRFRLDDDPAVPRGQQAKFQLASGTLQDVSVGFMRTADHKLEDGTYEITKGVLDEVSIVLRGAVPGAKVLALRSAQMIDAQVAGQITTKFAAGEMDLAEALTAMKEAAFTDTEKDEDGEAETETPAEEDPPTGTESEETALSDDEVKAIDAEIADALAVVEAL